MAEREREGEKGGFFKEEGRGAHPSQRVGTSFVRDRARERDKNQSISFILTILDLFWFRGKTWGTPAVTAHLSVPFRQHSHSKTSEPGHFFSVLPTEYLKFTHYLDYELVMEATAARPGPALWCSISSVHHDFVKSG